MKATLKNYHQAPRKVRLVADLIRGKSVPQAQVALTFLPKKSAPAMKKLLDSAIANARHDNESVDIDTLFVKTLTVDKGMTLKRMRPFKQGRAGRLHHIMSTVYLELAPKGGKTPKAEKTVVVADSTTEEKPVAKKTAKKAAKKAAKKTTK